MKKFILIFILLFCINIKADNMPYSIIASFNTLHLGYEGKDLHEFSKILINFDLIGLEEVMNEESMIELVKILNTKTIIKWGYHISPYPVGTNNYKEYYGYIWNKYSVALIKPIGYYKEKNENDFIREPYGAIFKVEEVDLTFVLVHLIYGDSISDRRKEAEKLYDVYNYFQESNGSDQDVIIGGDFNLNSSDKGFIKLQSHNDSITSALPDTKKTTIGKVGLSNAYDNFFYSKTYTKEIYYSDVMVPLNVKIYRDNISDHLPIYFVINNTLDDD